MSSGFSVHYQDLGIPSQKRDDAAYIFYVSVVRVAYCRLTPVATYGTHARVNSVPNMFQLPEFLVLAGTAGGMAPPAKWHHRPVLGSLLG